MSAQEILMEHSPDLQNSDWEELWETGAMNKLLFRAASGCSMELAG